MITQLTATDNAKKILVPKALLQKSGLGADAIVEAKKGEIRIIAAHDQVLNENALLSEKSLAVDWDKQEEKTAWKSFEE